ncbi:ABC transporter substrate-binding protein [Butyrivibrio sp. NC2002]|uniref:ABC transporter substrate-binding protein n=1 Tax=Butyrivibrio sp. NC2002 TaxID=1410610 RepID=UPI000689873D|nr:ABC transporter substrate-binding protein [Butyrivibrio sp. NC2002]
MRRSIKTFFDIKKSVLLMFLSFMLAGCGSISDGEYAASVLMEGGSGRAYIENPCTVIVKDGKVTADITWSSPNYDYMVVDGEKYYPVNTDGNSEFIIPVTIDKKMNVQADTTAMSKPYLIDYSLTFSLTDKEKGQEDGGKSNASTGEENTGDSADSKAALSSKEIYELTPPDLTDYGFDYISTDKNDYATGFAIHRYEDDICVVSVRDGRNYLILPEEIEAPDDTDDLIVLRKPLDKIYLAASGAMCQFDAIDEIGKIRLSGLEKDAWYIDSAIDAMDKGSLIYGGKYSAPDYEMMVMEEINLAIENTMILRTPKVREKLESIGIPVFIEWSNYESKPLGRCEWVKVYGLFTDKEKEAADAFKGQKEMAGSVSDALFTGKKVAIFSINANKQIVTRKSSDYFAKMVELAGGEYMGPEKKDDEKATSQVTISMEAFYNYAADADILIYNQAIEDAPASVAELVADNPVFGDFKACKEGKVWYTDKSLYQYADKIGTIISNLNEIFAEEKEETDFFHKLKSK